jgi:hypothetical protein
MLGDRLVEEDDIDAVMKRRFGFPALTTLLHPR